MFPRFFFFQGKRKSRFIISQTCRQTYKYQGTERKPLLFRFFKLCLFFFKQETRAQEKINKKSLFSRRNPNFIFYNSRFHNFRFLSFSLFFILSFVVESPLWAWIHFIQHSDSVTWTILSTCLSLFVCVEGLGSIFKMLF